MLDCILSLIRQWTLRPHIIIEAPVASLRTASLRTAGGACAPSFGSLDPFRPRTSAIINGGLLSLILFWMTIFALRYSWVHFVVWNIPAIAGNHTLSLNHARKSSKHVQVDVIPIDSDVPQSALQSESPSNNIASSPPAPAASVPTRGATISLDPYIGKYISYNPPAKISIQIEGEPLNHHLSLTLAGAGHSSLALSPISPSRFAVVGSANSEVDFTNDAEGKICCVSFVANGNVINAQRP